MKRTGPDTVQDDKHGEETCDTLLPRSSESCDISTTLSLSSATVCYGMITEAQMGQSTGGLRSAFEHLAGVGAIAPVIG